MAKSDRLDSRKLARWSAKGLVQPVRGPTLEEEGDRPLFRCRDQVVAKRRRSKQPRKSLLLQHGVNQPEDFKSWSRKGVEALTNRALSEPLRCTLDMLLEDLTHDDQQEQKARQAVVRLTKTNRHERAAIARQTVPGAGPVTTIAGRTELLAARAVR